MNKYNCYLNGEILPYSDCHLHVSDLLFQRGYGVFDFFRVRNGEIPWLEDYTERLFTSMQLSGIDIPFSKSDFHAIVHDLQNKNLIKNSAFKIIVTGGFSDNLNAVNGDPNIIILNVPWKKPEEETFSKGVNLITSEYLRPDPEIKSLFYFNLLKHRKEMKKHNAIDVLYHQNLISETSRANAFFVKDGSIITPETNILKGITRKKVLEHFRAIKTMDIQSELLFDFDEIFITSTSRDITPVVSIDGKKIGSGKPGKVTKEIMDEFEVKV